MTTSLDLIDVSPETAVAIRLGACAVLPLTVVADLRHGGRSFPSAPLSAILVATPDAVPDNARGGAKTPSEIPPHGAPLADHVHEGGSAWGFVMPAPAQGRSLLASGAWAPLPWMRTHGWGLVERGRLARRWPPTTDGGHPANQAAAGVRPSSGTNAEPSRALAASGRVSGADPRVLRWIGPVDAGASHPLPIASPLDRGATSTVNPIVDGPVRTASSGTQGRARRPAPSGSARPGGPCVDADDGSARIFDQQQRDARGGARPRSGRRTMPSSWVGGRRWRRAIDVADAGHAPFEAPSRLASPSARTRIRPAPTGPPAGDRHLGGLGRMTEARALEKRVRLHIIYI